MNILEKTLLQAIKNTDAKKFNTPIDSVFSTRTPKEKIKNIVRYSKKYKHITIALTINKNTITFKNGKICKKY